MKLEILVEHEAALTALGNVEFDDAQLAWDLSESLDEVKKHLKKFNELREALVKKIGKEDTENPGNYLIPDIKQFNDELQKVVDVDVKVKFPSFPLAKLNGAKVSASDMAGWRELKIVTKK